MGKLVSVNVGMPKDVPWKDKTVYTGIWKSPVEGPVMARRLNLDGDGQGDLAGHGGEHRAGDGLPDRVIRLLNVEWSPAFGTILDLAESCDVPTRFACRSGVCHVCETGVVEGSVSYVQSPLELPGPGSVLICSAAPASDLVMDL